MIDPEHLNDLGEMTTGHAARAAFLHAASAEGYAEDSFHQLSLDLYTLLVLTVGEKCTVRDVSSAVCVATDRLNGERDPENNVAEGDFDPYGDGSLYRTVPVEKFIREAAAALDAVSTYHVDDRVLIGQHRATAVSAVVVGQLEEGYWLVADKRGGTPRDAWCGEMWHVPLTQPTPFPVKPDGSS